MIIGVIVYCDLIPKCIDKLPTVDTADRGVYALARESYISKQSAERLHDSDTASPMFYKKYFDYLPAVDVLDASSAVELEPLDIEFEPLDLGEDDDRRVQLVQPLPNVLTDAEISVVNHRTKRDAPQRKCAVQSPHTSHEHLHQYAHTLTRTCARTHSHRRCMLLPGWTVVIRFVFALRGRDVLMNLCMSVLFVWLLLSHSGDTTEQDNASRPKRDAFGTIIMICKCKLITKFSAEFGLIGVLEFRYQRRDYHTIIIGPCRAFRAVRRTRTCHRTLCKWSDWRDMLNSYANN